MKRQSDNYLIKIKSKLKKICLLSKRININIIINLNSDELLHFSGAATAGILLPTIKG